VVPISVTTDIAGTESISVIVEKNSSPLAASFVLGSGAEGYVSTRIKMGKTSSVIGKEVKVTIGGCGG